MCASVSAQLQFDRIPDPPPLSRVQSPPANPGKPLGNLALPKLPPPGGGKKSNIPAIPPPVRHDFSVEEAKEVFKLAAGKGDTQTIYHWATKLWEGLDAPKDRNTALAWLNYAATAGNPNAQFFLGSLYQYGEGVLLDTQEALKWNQKAADQGHSRSQAGIGRIYLASGNLTHSYAWLCLATSNEAQVEDYILMRQLARRLSPAQVSAAQGMARQIVSKKQTSLGNAGVQDDKGVLVQQDRKGDLEGILTFARQGNMGSQLALGDLYHSGEVVVKDYRKAMEWYLKAAAQGSTAAQGNIGMMYYKGQGTQKDLVSAFAWLSIATANDDTRGAYKVRQAIARRMRPNQLNAAQNMGKQLVKKYPGMIPR